MIRTQLTPIVQKYGGSSLSTIDKVRAVARKIVRSAENGRPVVAVVSAMGKTTSELIDQAREVSLAPPRRELDMLLSSGERMSMALLAMAIEELGRGAISLTGPQCGIVTDDEHTNATILEVRPDRVSEELAAGNIVIVAGYQGVSTAGEVTTLGRGGSDTTAVALAVALQAERCEIYSDVSGVYTADPRIVREPRHLKTVDARLMAEYAVHGARVLHPPCIDLAHRHGVAVHALSTFGEGHHTVIAGDAGTEYSCGTNSELPVVGVTSRKSRVRMVGSDGASQDFEQVLAELSSMGDVLRGRSGEQHDCLLDVGDMPDAEGFTERLEEQLRGVASISDPLASVSIVAPGPFVEQVQGRVESVLRDAGAEVSSTYLRPLSITCAIEPAARQGAVRALHEYLVEAPLAVGV